MRTRITRINLKIHPGKWELYPQSSTIRNIPGMFGPITQVSRTFMCFTIKIESYEKTVSSH